MSGGELLIEELSRRDIRIAVVSNGAEASRQNTVACLPFASQIDAIFSSEKVGSTKPASAIFLAAAEHLQVRPEECWFVGDHPVNDYLGACLSASGEKRSQTLVWDSQASIASYKQIQFNIIYIMRQYTYPITALVHGISKATSIGSITHLSRHQLQTPRQSPSALFSRMNHESHSGVRSRLHQSACVVGQPDYFRGKATW
ncbi:HAD family hydrolase [Pseudomonas alliivorans]|uniref:HAD family hydrolase n=1 Tax=Pseudomonas alliivorans TaxID=2810613 RepID=UPI0035286E24